MDSVLQGKCILVAEDEEISRMIVEKILESKGAKVVAVSNGEEAVKEFLQSEEGYFDLLLLDFSMPKLGGIGACKQIRESKREDGNVVPIYGLTADLFIKEEELSDAGMNGCLEKPFECRDAEEILGG